MMKPNRLALLGRHLAPVLVLGALLATAPSGALAQRTAARSQTAKSADQREMENFHLTKAKMDKWLAAQWAIVKLAQEHPELASERRGNDDDDGSDQSLDAMAARIDKVPELRRELQRVGITAREYSLTTLAIFQASFAYAMKKQGMIKEIPADVPAAHVALVAQYEQEMTKLQVEMKKLEKTSPAEDTDDEDDEPVTSDSTSVRR